MLALTVSRVIATCTFCSTILVWASGYFLWDVVDAVRNVKESGVSFVIHGLFCFLVYCGTLYVSPNLTSTHQLSSMFFTSTAWFSCRSNCLLHSVTSLGCFGSCHRYQKPLSGLFLSTRLSSLSPLLLYDLSLGFIGRTGSLWTLSSI